MGEKNAEPPDPNAGWKNAVWGYGTGDRVSGVALLGPVAGLPTDHLLQRRAVLVVRTPSC